jgi:hypothetical protein
MVTTIKGLACDDSGRVCENHPDQPWDSPHASAWAELVRRAPAYRFGSTASLDDAKQQFKTVWLAFRAKHSPEAQQKSDGTIP